EIVAARQYGIELITRAAMVARIAADRTALAVGGTHGKTTTATMLTLILREAGLDPSFILGGESADLSAHAARGAGAHIVLEADEYGRAFHAYRPSVAVITNLEPDHLDYYATYDALTGAFVEYGKTVRQGGALIVGAESDCALRVAQRVFADRPDLTLQTFGLAQSLTWSALDLREDEERTQFRLEHESEEVGGFQLRVPGAHNVRNALAAIATAVAAGADVETARRALAAFRGVRRRFQRLGESRGVLVLDDYAHHPTEIEATIAAARTRFPTRRLVVLYQPHTYSRSAYLLEGFQRCFQGVDRLYLTDTYAAREQPQAGLTAVDLAARIDSPGAIYVGALDEAPNVVVPALRDGDLLITMGAGDVEHAGPRILERLEVS
ncbi:MAG: UDP-N-acetylmuramate--L-alanine ligase, partial [Dehalococcoidia bacterium]